MGVIVVAGFPKLNQMADDKVASGTVEMIRGIQVAARDHRTTTGAWPATINDLILAGEIPAGAATTPYGTPWVFSVVGVDLFRVSIDTTDTKYATRLAGSDLPFLSRAGNVISSDVTRAGLEQAHNALYSRDGSKPLTGDMDAANHNILNVANLGSNSVTTTQVTSSNINNSGSISTDILNANTINSPGGVTTGTVTTTGPITSGGDVYAPRFIDSDNSGYLADPNGNSKFKRVTLDDPLEFTNTVTSGSPCTGRKIAIDSVSGGAVSCIAGVWSSGGSAGSTVIAGSVGNGGLIPVPTAYAATPWLCSAVLTFPQISRARTYIASFDAYGSPGGGATCRWSTGDRQNYGGVTNYNGSCNYIVICNN
jgi:hypothetical protein